MLRRIYRIVRRVSGAYGRRVRRAGRVPSGRGRAAWIAGPIVALLLFCGLAAPGRAPAVTDRDVPAVPTMAAAPTVEPTLAPVDPTVEPVPTVEPAAETSASPAETSASPAETSAAPGAVSGPVQPVGGACPDDAPIKGNADSKIYHVPGGSSYSRTTPEQCFRTAADAEAAGYRAAKR